MPTTWKLKDYLYDHKIKPAKLASELEGKVSRTAIYGLVGKEPPKAVYLETLDAVLPALRELTGEDVQLSDLLEYVAPESPRKKTWRDLIGAAGDVDGPTDMAERHDDYLGEALLEEHERMHLRGER